MGQHQQADSELPKWLNKMALEPQTSHEDVTLLTLTDDDAKRPRLNASCSPLLHHMRRGDALLLLADRVGVAMRRRHA